jgi:hypothetical protein
MVANTSPIVSRDIVVGSLAFTFPFDHAVSRVHRGQTAEMVLQTGAALPELGRRQPSHGDKADRSAIRRETSD